MDPFARKMILSTLAFMAAMLLMLGALSLVYLHTHPTCTEELLAQVDSPDGRWTAAVMRRRCGEESPFFVHVNLRSAGTGLRYGFFSGRASAEEVFVAEQDSPEIAPELTWASSTELRIRCAGCRDTHQETRWGPVEVR
ncbi:MAG TPA: hypothetical protein VKW06_05920 [Candidatus Angelobacter sp.]|nr:hypothetical protein [Candidatus Angelobacter sp.]